jgi:hypothetical protein
MLIKKQIVITVGLFAVIALSVAATIAPQPQGPPKPTNLKVFPKSISGQALGHEMNIWAASLGVKCNFCHVRNDQTGKMDFASDAKPEKNTARFMLKMTQKINKKYFDAKKDSLGMVMMTGINCYTCHKGTAHPEAKLPEMKGPGGPPPGGPGAPPPGGPGAPPPGGPGAPPKG